MSPRSCPRLLEAGSLGGSFPLSAAGKSHLSPLRSVSALPVSLKLPRWNCGDLAWSAVPPPSPERAIGTFCFPGLFPFLSLAEFSLLMDAPMFFTVVFGPTSFYPGRCLWRSRSGFFSNPFSNFLDLEKLVTSTGPSGFPLGYPCPPVSALWSFFLNSAFFVTTPLNSISPPKFPFPQRGFSKKSL